MAFEVASRISADGGSLPWWASLRLICLLCVGGGIQPDTGWLIYFVLFNQASCLAFVSGSNETELCCSIVLPNKPVSQNHGVSVYTVMLCQFGGWVIKLHFKQLVTQ